MEVQGGIGLPYNRVLKEALILVFSDRTATENTRDTEAK
jgi:hypothetical protein